MNNIYENCILLIGGMSIGKSTISELLGNSLRMNVVSIDAVKHEILEKNPNYNFETQLKIRKEKGYYGEIDYLIPFLNMSLEYTIDNLSKPCIIDLNAFFENQLNNTLINKIKQFNNIVYLYTDQKENILERRKIDINSELGKIYLTTLNNPINDVLCSIKINVDNKTPEEIVNSIIEKINSKTHKN